MDTFIKIELGCFSMCAVLRSATHGRILGSSHAGRNRVQGKAALI